jgi:sugar phosphate isomerase/epimerase
MKLTRIVPVLAISLFSSCLYGQEVGLQLYSLRTQFEQDAAGTMARVKEMGIREIEMKGTHGLSFPEFIKLLAVNGISVISFEAEYEKLDKFPQVVADEARSYGAKYIVCSGLPPSNGESTTKEDIDKIAAALNHAGKIVSRNGMMLCYQPSGYEFKANGTGTLFDYMVEKLDSRFVHFEMDVYRVKQGGQDPVALLKKYPTRFILMQLKDGKAVQKAKPDFEANVVLGSGDVGIKNVMETARELGIQHYFIEDESPRADKQIPKSIAYVRSLNEKVTAKK